jgi:parallel beta-helix repeat protein
MNRRVFLNLFGLAWLTSISPIALIKSVGGIELLKTSSKEIVFYVAPNGNDAWSGNKPSPQGKKGPFATLSRARDAVHQLKQRQSGLLKQPVRVLVRGGTYFTEKTIDFTDADSGTKESPIIYQAYKNETPIISGGKLIKNWTRVKINNKVAWTTTLPEVKEGKWAFHQLWVNGHRAQRCRYPKKGYLKVEKSPDVTPEWNKGQSRFQYRQGDLKAWKDLTQAEIVVMSRWLESRLPIREIDAKSRIVSFTEPTPLRIEAGNSGSSGAGVFYVENIIELLNDPGEWYINYNTGQVFYLPRPGEQLSNAQFVAPVLPELCRLVGDWKSKKLVEYLRFEGIIFAHGEWYYPKQTQVANPTTSRVNLSGGQASFYVPAFIYAQGVRSCSWKKCTFSHIGHYAIDFTENSSENEVIGCTFHDLGAGAVKIGSGQVVSDGKQKISKCHIYDGGKLFHSAVAIWVGKSSQNIIASNHIHDFYYSGISVGWTWGYSEKPDASNNIIQNNHIHHIGRKSNGDGPILNDKGGIYTLGIQPGTIIRGNLIHDIDAYNFVACGIYLDEGSSDILVENNIVHHVNGYSFHFHYGRNNKILKNIFAFAKTAQLYYSNSKKDNKSIMFEQNIIYWKEGSLLAGTWKDMNFNFDRNIYWNQGNYNIKFDNLSLKDWQSKGMDVHSRIIDPLFVAPSKGDFRFQAKSPAFMQ